MNAKQKRAARHNAEKKHCADMAHMYILPASSKHKEKSAKALPRWRRGAAQFDGGTWIKIKVKPDFNMP